MRFQGTKQDELCNKLFTCCGAHMVLGPGPTVVDESSMMLLLSFANHRFVVDATAAR